MNASNIDPIKVSEALILRKRQAIPRFARCRSPLSGIPTSSHPPNALLGGWLDLKSFEEDSG